MSQVDLLVVNYNTKDKLKRLLDELHSDDNKSWKLYISDNGSTDGSTDWLFKHAADYRIESLYFNHNIGYAGAINLLATEGDSEYLAALNADVWMTSGDVKSVLDGFGDESVAVVGPKQRDEHDRITHAGIIGTNEAPRHRGWKTYDPDDSLYRDRLECVTVSGSAFFMRRGIWDELTECEHYEEFNRDRFGYDVKGAFLNTRHYYEETAFSYHARHHGYKVLYDGTVSIGHSWHASSKVGGSADKLFAESRDIFRDFCDRHGIDHD